MAKNKVLLRNWIWLGVFVVWTALLSGFFSSLTGTPGVVQALNSRELLDSKKETLTHLEETILIKMREKTALESNPKVQEAEIRKVLGYAASDELVFDFSDRR